MLILMYGIASKLSKTQMDGFISLMAIGCDTILIMSLIPLFICAFGGICK